VSPPSAGQFVVRQNAKAARPWPAAAPVDARCPFTFQRDHVARLRAGRNVDRELGVVEKLQRHRRAERGFRKRNTRAGGQVEPVTLELLVWLELDVDVEIAGFTAHRTGQTLARNTKPLVRVDAGRERDQDLARALDLSGPAALGARVAQRRADAVASRACGGEHHEAARARYLSGTAARRARLSLRTSRGARAAARFASCRRAHDHFFLAAHHRFFERQSLLNAKVGAPARARPSASLLPAPDEELGK